MKSTKISRTENSHAVRMEKRTSRLIERVITAESSSRVAVLAEEYSSIIGRNKTRMNASAELAI